MNPHTVRIALASRDGLKVDRHLGQAEGLAIYDGSPEGVVFVEYRRIELAGSEAAHSEPRAAEILRLVDDCAVVVARQVGPTFRQYLECRGIRVLTSNQDVPPVLDRIARSYLTRRSGRDPQPGVRA